jgi:hypothetical protein
MIRSRAGSEHGFALMEVVISAAVLLLVVLGVMAALDSVAGTAGANKARTVAAALAEKDQEELRSLKTADLNNIRALIPGPRTVTVDGVQYTIESDATLVTDATGEDISCTLEDGSGSFLRITSKVTSPMTGARVKPVVLTSIVAPEPGSGTLVARVVNARDQAVRNLPVQAIGPETKTKSTNEAGCAVFGAMSAGNYQVKVSQMGWVNPDGEQEVIKNSTVAAGQLTTVDFEYDVGARVNAEIRTFNNGAPAATVDNSYGAIAAHTGISTRFRVFPEAGPLLQTTQVLDKLFPFDDAYKIYSGRCTGADPTLFEEPYFDQGQPGHPAAPELQPGEERNIVVYEPAVNLAATFQQSSWTNSHVYAYPRTEDCTEPTRYDMGLVATGGRAERPGLPFGSYDICVQFRYSGNWYRRTRTGIANDRLVGTNAQPIHVTTSGSGTQTGSCPA